MIKTIFLNIFLISALIGQSVEQIKQAKEMVKKMGMSESQARSLAKQKGYTDKQIDSAISKDRETKVNAEVDYKKINNKAEINESDISETNNFKSGSVDVEDLEIVDDVSLDIVNDEINYETVIRNTKVTKNFFGYDIFKQDPGIFQNSSLGAIDPDYLIGPGDEIILMLWGETQFRQEIIVNREGFVFIPEVGQVFVNGLSLSLLESKLFRVLSQSYASLNPPNRKATTFLDVSLGNLRPLRIQVLGEVSQPGAYTISPSSTLFSSLYYFNGPTTLGSLRDIQLIRGDKKIASIDFYDFLLFGKKSKDQKLNLDDIIFIPKRMKTVSIQGEVNRPGFYELREDEGLGDLLKIAGGLKTTAYLDRSQIDRIVPFKNRSELGIDRMLIDVDLNESIMAEKSFPLQDQDEIIVFSVLDMRQNTATISGAITRPGKFDLGDSLSLKELIVKADGLLGDAYMERVDVIRTKPDFSEELIKLNLNDIMDGNIDLKLTSLDRVTVFSMSEMISKTYVSIYGHIKKPGLYLLQENMTLLDLIFKGGGYIDEDYKKSAYLNRAELIRVFGKEGEKKVFPFNLEQVLDKKDIASMELYPDDQVKIYSLEEIKGPTQYVSISGHVKNPGQYELFETNMTLYDLLFKSGGFQDKYFKSKTYLKRADLIRRKKGEIHKEIIQFSLRDILEKSNDSNNYKLKPGDEIRVYSKDIFNHSKKVTINGAIRSPGDYDYKLGMTVKDLIIESGGLTQNIFKYKIDIKRLDQKYESEDNYSKIINLDLIDNYSFDDSLKVNSEQENFPLRPYDVLTIREDKYINRDFSVTITGEVFFPGNYVIMNSKENIKSIIERAGGLTKKSYLEASKFYRNKVSVAIEMKKIYGRNGDKYDILVKDGDIIMINTRPEIVEVVGEVNRPGIYKYKKNQRIKDLIMASGGLSMNAEKKDIYITFPNGISKKYNSIFSNYRVKDGSVLTIGSKDKEEDFDKTEYAKELTSIFANLAQVVSILLLARN